MTRVFVRTLDISLGERQEGLECENCHRGRFVLEHGRPPGIIRNGERGGSIKATRRDERVGDLHGLARTQYRSDVCDCEIDRDDLQVRECAKEGKDRPRQVIARSATWPDQKLSRAHRRYDSVISARKDEPVDDRGGDSARRFPSEVGRQRRGVEEEKRSARECTF